MLAIKPGMTRGDLLRVFTSQGGLSTGLQETFASQDCPLFHVNVEFTAVGRPTHDKDRVTLSKSNQDLIARISTPYLAGQTID